MHRVIDKITGLDKYDDLKNAGINKSANGKTNIFLKQRNGENKN